MDRRYSSRLLVMIVAFVMLMTGITALDSPVYADATTVKVSTAQELMTALERRDEVEIVMSNDIIVDNEDRYGESELHITGSKILNMNGKTLSGNPFFTINSAGTSFRIYGNGTVISNSIRHTLFQCGSSANVTIEDGTYIMNGTVSTSTAYSITCGESDDDGSGGCLTINGGDFYNAGCDVIRLKKKNRYKLVINDGAFVSKSQNALEATLTEQGTNVIINGGTFCSNNATSTACAIAVLQSNNAVIKFGDNSVVYIAGSKSSVDAGSEITGSEDEKIFEQDYVQVADKSADFARVSGATFVGCDDNSIRVRVGAPCYISGIGGDTVDIKATYIKSSTAIVAVKGFDLASGNKVKSVYSSSNKTCTVTYGENGLTSVIPYETKGIEIDQVAYMTGEDELPAGFSYDEATNTLTLNNVSCKSIVWGEDTTFNIYLKGDNTIENTSTGTKPTAVLGAGGDMVIDGDANATLKVTNSGKLLNYGISAKNLTLKAGDISVNAQGSGATYAINATSSINLDGVKSVSLSAATSVAQTSAASSFVEFSNKDDYFWKGVAADTEAKYVRKDALKFQRVIKGTGEPVEPLVSIDGFTKGADYTVEYFADEACTQPVEESALVEGEFYAKVANAATPGAVVVVKFKIGEVAFDDLKDDATIESPVEYAGSALTPAVSIMGLTQGEDYTVEYKNNVNCGTATAVVTGVGELEGSFELSFQIKALDMAKADCQLEYTSVEYDGTQKKPAVTIGSLVEGKDYTVSYGPNNSCGSDTGSVTVTGINNCTGSNTLYFEITKKNIANCDIKLTPKSCIYTEAGRYEPKVTIDGLEKGVDYTVSYKNNVSVGTATAVVTGIGNYTGTKEVPFEIVEQGAAIFAEGNPLRIYGGNRYETSLKLADAYRVNIGDEPFDNIIVAYGGNYPDALAGGYLAKVKNAPLITVDVSTEASVQAYIKKNLAEGGTVYILGGEGVVRKEFRNKLTASGIKSKRLAGSNRFETNLAILNEAGVDNELIVCNAYSYADSLSASAVGKPILLVDKEYLTDAQKKFVKDHKISNCYLIGGEGVIMARIKRDLLKNMDPDTLDYVVRLAGNSRYETSTAVAEKFFPNSKIVVLAYGQNFPDGLSGGPVAQTMAAPLILITSDNTEAAKTYYKATGADKVLVIGGKGLISDEAVNRVMGN